MSRSPPGAQRTIHGKGALPEGRAPLRERAGGQPSKTPASARRFSVAPQPSFGWLSSRLVSSARILAPCPAAARIRISSTKASESVLRCAVLPLVRFRTYAKRPLASGIRYLYSPSTLSAPPVPWPARTDARAVFEVLPATAGLLEKAEKGPWQLYT